MLLGLACLGGTCLLAVCIFSLVAAKPYSSALSSTRANRVSAVSFVPSCSVSSFAGSHFSDSTLFCWASQSDLEVGQGWHVLFATTAVFHGGSCHFSVWFHLIWISTWLLKYNSQCIIPWNWCIASDRWQDTVLNKHTIMLQLSQQGPLKHKQGPLPIC